LVLFVMFSRTDLKNRVGEPCYWTAVGTAVIPPDRRFSHSSFQQVEGWLRRCLGGHALCKSGSEVGTKLPTRILDVGDPRVATKEEFQVTLRETQNEDGKYVCLSYCWGNSAQVLKTEKATPPDRKKGIDWSSLAKTFQCAIVFIRRLGLRYLWVDSLCILQDSDEDWQRESAKMASIYHNSLLTLAASGACDVTQGIDCKTPAEYLAHELSGTSPDGAPYTVYARRTVPHWYDNEWSTGYFPLFSRAWAYQERLLAPRVLHFGDRELIWECMELTDCECSLRPIYDRDNKRWHAFTLRGETSARDLANRWRRMVNQYSKLALTRPTDRLSALAGCAKEMQPLRRREVPGRPLGGYFVRGPPLDSP
jgi:hypothetical protein